MEEFRASYKTLYKTEKRFFKAVYPRCDRKVTPSELRYVKDIGKLLTPRDPAFKARDEDRVARQFLVVKELTMAVLRVLERSSLLLDKYKAWFTRKAEELQGMFMLQTMLLSALRLSDGPPPDILSSGPGGVNTTVRSSALKRSTAEHLVSLTAVLRVLEQQQTSQ